MNKEKVKSFIWKAWFAIILIVTLVLFALGLTSQILAKQGNANTIFSEEAGIIITAITSLVSPSMLFGVAWKMVLNKKHQSKIKEIVEPYEPVKIKEIKNEMKKAEKVMSKNGIDYLRNGDTLIITKNRTNLSFEELLAWFEEDNQEFINKLRNKK